MHLVHMLAERIPPCGSDLSGAEDPRNRAIDFRHILFGGWIASANVSSDTEANGPKLEFSEINKLCEMGILHQRAIDLHDKRKKQAIS